MKSTRLPLVTRLPGDLRRQMYRVARRNHQSLNGLIEEALRRHLAQPSARHAPERAVVTSIETKGGGR